MFYWVLKILFGPLFRVVWIKKVEGLENIPEKGNYIIAANHSSYFDFFSLVSIWPKRVYFLAGEVFFKKWWWYPLVKLTGQIRVDRDITDKTESKEKVLFFLKQGRVMGIFPEGTRSSDGNIGKTFTGVAGFALNGKVSVIPVGIKGTYRVMSRHDRFPKFKKVIEIKIGKPMYFEKDYNNKDDKTVLREVTDKIINEIAFLYSSQI